MNNTPEAAREATRADIAAVIAFSEDGEYIEQLKGTETENSQKINHLLQDKDFLQLLLDGGVAHDFNNLLTPIMGYAQLGLRAVPDGDERLRTNLLI